MQIGVVLPTFAESPQRAFDAARAVEDGGLDGAFTYDHLWPMGQPGRPAISPYPLLGALAAMTDRIHLGTLVARVGLVPDEVLVGELCTIDRLSGGRCIAGVGVGDHKSRPENEAYGIEFAPPNERRAALERIVGSLHSAGISTWIGGGSLATNEIAWRTGSLLNLWGASIERVAELSASGPVTWGGVLPEEPGSAAKLLAGLAAAGAKWAVLAWPGAVTPIVAALEEAGVAHQG